MIKRVLTWQDFDTAIAELVVMLADARSIYGEPRGGLILAATLSNHLGIPLVAREEADVWIDDVIDTGSTYVKAPESRIHAAWVSKNRNYDYINHVTEAEQDEWVVFPWEPLDDRNEKQYTSEYLVNDLYATIQGEGVQTGVPMILLRLHGCAVGCPFCDTKETWNIDPLALTTFEQAKGATPSYAKLSARAIVEHIQAVSAGEQWIMITGGEPADQNLKPLVEELHVRGFKVAIETSGTAIGHVDCGADWICVSPKISMPGGRSILPPALEVADEIKHVIGKPSHIEALDDLLRNVHLKQDCVICLQPMSQSQKATELCIRTASIRGWRVSLQIHKYLNLR